MMLVQQEVSSRAGSKRRIRFTRHWKAFGWISILIVAFALMIRSDLIHLDWVAKLSLQGSPPPEQDADSPTGYALGQRHFLGSHERGVTYRWIAYTQQLLANGFFDNSAYHGDTVPLGRPQLLPKLYCAWVTAVAWPLHLFSGEPLAVSVEQAALWEPVVTHALAFLAAVVLMWLRFGPAAGGATGLFFALFPPIAGQFIPGVLTSETWAMLLAAYGISLTLPVRHGAQTHTTFSIRSAVACGLSLWLEPAYGFPAILITAFAGSVAIADRPMPLSSLRWAAIGSTLSAAGWLIDGNPWATEAGELRYNHPLYAMAWLGIGLGLHGWQRWRETEGRSKRHLAVIAVAGLLFATLFVVQIIKGYPGWLYPSASLSRITALDETVFFKTAFNWFAEAPGVELALLIIPAAGAAGALVIGLFSNRQNMAGALRRLLPSVTAISALLLLAAFLVRWWVVLALVALPLVWWAVSHLRLLYRQVLSGLGVAFLIALMLAGQALPLSLQRPSAERGPIPADAEMLLYRHFSHWMATHHPERRTAALAPPELSDALVFHGGGHALMSTSWESYQGQVAASRILSAPESTEAEAVLESREVTHLIVTSWDKVLPLLVRTSEGDERAPLYELLQRWVYPPYLRPIPYQMPPMPGFEAEKLALFKFTGPQDEALSLSRLAEYFVEMKRPEPARLVARALAESYPDDPNAAMARAMVYADLKDSYAFKTMLAKLVEDAESGLTPRDWDRRVLRATVFALGKQHKLARSEIQESIRTMTRESLYMLTPLQVFHLTQLMEMYGFDYPSAEMKDLADARSSEYSKGSSQ